MGYNSHQGKVQNLVVHNFFKNLCYTTYMDLHSKAGFIVGLNNRLKQIKEYQKKNNEQKRKDLMSTNYFSFHRSTKYHRLLKDADEYARKIQLLTQ